MASSDVPFTLDDWNLIISQINNLAEFPTGGCVAVTPLAEAVAPHKLSKADILAAQNKLLEICSSNTFSPIPEKWKVYTIQELEDAILNGWCNCEFCCWTEEEFDGMQPPEHPSGAWLREEGEYVPGFAGGLTGFPSGSGYEFTVCDGAGYSFYTHIDPENQVDYCWPAGHNRWELHEHRYTSVDEVTSRITDVLIASGDVGADFTMTCENFIGENVVTRDGPGGFSGTLYRLVIVWAEDTLC